MIHIIKDTYFNRDADGNEYTREDGQLVEKWLAGNAEDIAAKIEKIRITTAKMSEEVLRHMEIPTGIATESRLGEAMLRMAQKVPETFGLLFIIQGHILRILPEDTPISAKSAEIMNIDDNFSVRPEVVITIDI